MKYLFLVLWVAATVAASMANAAIVPAKIGEFPQEIARHYTRADGLPANNVVALRIEAGAIIAITTDGAARFAEGRWEPIPDYAGTQLYLTAEQDGFMLRECSADALFEDGVAVRQAAGNTDEPEALATADGLYLRTPSGAYEKAAARDGQGRLWGAADVRGVAVDSTGNLWFATPAGAACRTDDGWKFYTGAEGLPYNDFTCMGAGGDGSVWFGTKIGAIRYKGGQWRYRQGRRWLPDDEVRGIVVNQDGSAWFATDKGVGWIGHQSMTLAEKAAFYEEEMEKYIRRTPFGYVSKATLPNPGDKSQIVLTDSDNDGLWTSMYGAGECFAYAATKDPLAKDRAKRAFEALRFLQKVTQTGEIKPPKGYVARTILPTDGPDPNEGRLERDKRHREQQDALWKLYEPRWPKSGDGKWYWKSDTSSDELDGHYFFYPAYYDYVADTEQEKERVREVVRDLTDHLIEHDFCLIDIDGTPTRWSVYSPESLNNDKNWWPERGLKSLSMLSYLAVAEHMTGDPKYGEISRELQDKHHYHTNAMIYKIHFGPGSGNQSDDEMAFMCYYNLMKYSKDEALRDMIHYSFYSAWTNEQPEQNPLFNFMYAAFGIDVKHANPWGAHDISIWDGWLEDSIETLLDFPLDRVGWGHRNSHRVDLLLLPPQQASEPYEPRRRDRGYRNNGKTLPVSERFFHHWNTDPWTLNYGGNGGTLGSGTVFLLPYYMGLYHGFIE
ncbi:MAG TPA: hypothetical protein ENN29_02160 [Candidatus Hydrogenedentes bacterium]|nr:hypothetical protein [Candidatus Hydrogenedentota bacterium]